MTQAEAKTEQEIDPVTSQTTSPAASTAYAGPRHDDDTIGRVLRVLRLAARGVYRSQLPRMAAALAYRTIFSLIPLFVIGLVVLGAFATDEQKRSAVTQLLEFSGLSEIVIEPAAPAAEEAFQPVGAFGAMVMLPARTAETVRRVTSQEDIAGAIAEATEGPEGDDLEGKGAAAERLDDWIAQLVDQVTDIKFGAIGIVGVLTLIYAAISMLVEVERSFNHIYRVRVGRSWTRRVAQYWTVLTLGGMFLVLTFGVSEGAKAWLRSRLGVEDGGSFLALGLGFIVTVTISTVLFFTLYASIPNTRVRISPALIGAGVAAVLWEAGKWAFTSYLSYTTVYASLYGSIALIPLFLLWVYVTWLVILFGLQVAHMLQTFGEWSEHDLDESAARFIEPTIALHVAGAVARAFVSGKPLGADDLSDDLGVPASACALVLDRLSDAGLIHAVERGDDEVFALARPPGSISVAELLEVGDSLVATPEGGVAARASGQGVGTIADTLRLAQRQAVQGRSLADLAGLRDDKPTSAEATRPAPKVQLSEEPA
ncbi:MAG: YhjD/YihY/BrkB family envelope integrity protein [Planctomycetota bacterium]